ncbi:MAG: hypothetical protein IKW38_06710 [Kiritimatiellae bacterium]|nr:hypothetical protein [Kiritimatiellia bacterium]
MNITNRLYPYPILSKTNGTILDSTFDVVVKPKIIQEGLVITCSVTATLKNKDLKQLVENGNAGIFVHVECPTTTFREVYQITPEECRSLSNETLQGETVIEISSGKISGKVEICPFIIARNDFVYSNQKAEAFYQGMTFDIDAGAILAEGVPTDFRVNIARTQLKSTNSIFVTVPSTDEKQTAMNVDCENNRIRISMPQAMFQCYQAMKTSTANDSMLWSLIIIPAFVSTLEQVKLALKYETGVFGDFSQYSWFASVNRALIEKFGFGLDSEKFVQSDTVELASVLIGNPLESVLNELVHGEGEDEQ